MMKTVCGINQCCGCMACVNVCKFQAITVKDDLKYYNAEIDDKKCVNCNRCHAVCPNNNSPEYHSPLWWYQGWANADIREHSSSGGVASAIAKAFIENGGCVASCYYSNGQFIYKIVDTVEELKAFRGSKYVKSNAANIYSLIQERIKYQKLLFIGLPCQVAALKNIVGEKWKSSLYTVDLICHGTPSPQILSTFFCDYGYNIKQIRTLDFRKKNNFNICVDGKILAPVGMRDRYTIGFLRGLFYTDNCYKCKFARGERIGDVTLGDSWGTMLSKDEQHRGVSLILIQNERGKSIVEVADLSLMEVSLERAVASNHQLERPSVPPREREVFFRYIGNGKSFNRAFFACYKREFLRQEGKKILISARLWRRK